VHSQSQRKLVFFLSRWARTSSRQEDICIWLVGVPTSVCFAKIWFMLILFADFVVKEKYSTMADKLC
jgi:hypothetical protein